jgi:CENP-Q, a CENPA-CAD centromere complex subunit
MEERLVPDLQLIAQLEKEVEQEKMMLEEEENQLNNLTKNASREESARKAQMKKVVVFRGVSLSRCIRC